MNRSKYIKVFQTAIIILVCAIIFFAIYKFASSLFLNVDLVKFGTYPTTHDPYRQYNAGVTMPAEKGGLYYFRLEDLNGTMMPPAPNTANRESVSVVGTYYSITVVISTNDKTEANAFQENKDLVASIIRDVMSDFRPENLMNEHGRDYLKSRIKQRVTLALNLNNVDDVYFEKFFMQPIDAKF